MEWKGRMLPFKVDGPPEALELLESAAPGADWSGCLSPPAKISIKGRRARLAGIPENAEFYAFAHPLACLEGQYESLAPSQPWEYFVLLGGYVYFDADRQLLACNALVHFSSATCLHLIGPFQPSATALTALRQQGRLVATTLAPLREAGFEKIAWVNPRETPGGGTLLADGTEIQNNGCFVYELAGGSQGVLYQVVNLATFGLKDDDSRNSGSVNFALSPSKAESGASAKMESAQSWKEKASLMRSKTFTYRPSAVGLLPESDDTAPAKIDPRNYTTMQSYSPSTLGLQDKHAALSGVFNTMQDAAQRTQPKAAVQALPDDSKRIEPPIERQKTVPSARSKAGAVSKATPPKPTPLNPTPPKPTPPKPSPPTAAAPPKPPPPKPPEPEPKSPVSSERGFFEGLLGLVTPRSDDGHAAAPPPAPPKPPKPEAEAFSSKGMIEALKQQVERLSEEVGKQTQQQRKTTDELGKLRKENEALKGRVAVLEKAAEAPRKKGWFK